MIEHAQLPLPPGSAQRPYSAPSSLSQKRPSAQSLSLKIGSLDEIRIPGLELDSIKEDSNLRAEPDEDSNIKAEAASAAQNNPNHFTIDSIEFVKMLGSGSAGSVQLILHKLTKKLMAKKSISLYTSSEEGGITTRTQILRELRILRNCSHPNIVSFFGAFLYCGELSIMMEYMDLGCLDAIYKKNGGIAERLVSCIANQLLQGLRYLHDEMKVIHRDIKPQNMLLNSSGEIKISDFGISKEFEGKGPSSFVGTIIYLSPEVLQKRDSLESTSTTSQTIIEPSSFVSDIWSFGLSIIEIATARFPYPTEGFNSSFDIVPLLLEEPSPTLDSTYSAPFQTFVSLCLIKDPKERPTAAKLLETEFAVKGIDQSDLDVWAKSLSK